MVRRAVATDAPHLLDVAAVFNDKYCSISLNPAKALTSLSLLIKEGVVFTADTGAIVGQVYEDPFRDRTLLLEIGWYAEDDSMTGIRLLRAFIAEGRKLKVDAIVMSILSTSNPRVGLLLDRLGFTHTESAYTLEL